MGKMNQLAVDMKELSPQDFFGKYKRTKSEYMRILSNLPPSSVKASSSNTKEQDED